MPDKVAKRSRNVGSKPKSETEAKKRGRPPKTESAPTPETFDVEPATDTPITPSAAPVPAQTTSNALSHSNQLKAASETYTGLIQVPHGLTIPSFDPNTYFASDLFTDTSTLAETDKNDADRTVESIEKKRHTLRVVGANIALNTDVVRVANDYRKFEGTVIDYAATGVNNETKFIGYQTAGINKDVALNRFDQANERLTQGQNTLAGMKSITPLITEEWTARKSLKASQIQSLQLAATQAKDELQPKLMQVSQEFKQEIEGLN